MAKKLRTLLPMTDMAIGRYRGQSLFWSPKPEGYDAGNVLARSTYSDVGITRYNWIVPEGASIGTFEIWGQGGHGAGSRCCQQGVDGGSGAYARKTIKLIPGDTYVFCHPLHNSCCYYRESNLQYGGTDDGACCAGSTEPGYGEGPIRGNRVYVLGHGLCNFCAEGGEPGVTCCFVHANYFGNDMVYKCDIVARRIGDSDGDPLRRACYYGTNHGARGVYGSYQFSCCGGWHDSYMCGSRTGTPYPGGLFMWGRPARGGQVMGNLGIDCQTCHSLHDGRSGRKRYGSIGGAWYTRAPGMGGQTSNTITGHCLCGSQGAFGAVRVIWE